jgi:integrase
MKPPVQPKVQPNLSENAPAPRTKARRPRGDGSIFFHAGSQRWACAVSLGKDAAGKRVRLFFYARTKSELQRKIFDERARGGGTIAPRAKGKLRDLVDAWLADEVKPNRSASTWVSYEQTWRVHVEPILGRIALDDLGPDHVLLLMRRLRATDVSASMIDRAMRIMHRALAVAIRQGRYHRPNPFAMVDRPKLEPRESRSLSIAEARRFVAAAADDRYEALWIVLLTCGLRIGEALGLRWSDVDFERRTLIIRRSRSEVGEDGPHDGELKTRSSRRTVTFGQLAYDALERRRNAPDAVTPITGAIFVTGRGTIVLRSNLRRDHFFPLLERAGIETLRIHDLRHTSTSIGLAGGVPVRAMADRSGHAKIQTTLAIYAHTMQGTETAAAEAIDAALVPEQRRKSKVARRRQISQ